MKVNANLAYLAGLAVASVATLAADKAVRTILKRSTPESGTATTIKVCAVTFGLTAAVMIGGVATLTALNSDSE